MTRTWTEGVCSDGAAILCDGVPVPISELLTHLNRCEFIRSAALEEAARVAEKYREIAAQNSSFRDGSPCELTRKAMSLLAAELRSLKDKQSDDRTPTEGERQ